MPTIDHYLTPLKLPMSIDQFSRFPYLAAYRADFREGHAEFTYQPRLRMARLPIAPRVSRIVPGIAVKTLDLHDAHESLTKLFASAFAHLPPMDTMPPTTRRHAAEAAIRHTASGGDGEVVESACVGATDRASGKLVGAALVTRVSLRWDEWPDAATPAFLPNLTWIFVKEGSQRRQIGSAMLDGVINRLAEQNRPWLVSHFIEANASSLLFHWRNGFELVPAIAKP